MSGRAEVVADDSGRLRLAERRERRHGLDAHAFLAVDDPRGRVHPVVRRVATANGFSGVMFAPSLFWYDGAIDITDKVTDEVQKDKPAHTIPEAQPFNLKRVASINAPPMPTTGPTSMPSR